VTVDINSKDFIETFKMANATVGQIGFGFIGKAVYEFFKDKCAVVVYDKAIPADQNGPLSTLDDVVARSEVICIAVPTPMRKDGSCYTGFIDEVLQNIKETAAKIGRNVDSFVIVIKSTVYPGFTEEMQDKYLPMRIVFSPEFLTEANSINDFKNTNRIIVGGDQDDALVVCKYFAEADLKMLDGKRLIIQTDSTTAELVKLYANGMLATKVMFSNEMYQICLKLGVNYEDVRQLAVLDDRIGAGHTIVPGPDGCLGIGGHCFIKDLNNIKDLAKRLGTGEKIVSVLLERNLEVRDDRNWESQKDRVVTDK
jgi:nucleotide sugar dehydrogenase